MLKAKVLSVAQEAQIEIIIKKSRFIAAAFPVQHESEAACYIAQLTKKHKHANHNVYAYVIHDQLQRFSDDGEPSGTAGRPILDVIKQQQLLHTAIVVTRYFGGVLLGAGGLVRAYTEAAAKALATAGIVEKRLYRQLDITMDYQWLGAVKYELVKADGQALDIDYKHQVFVKTYLPPATIEGVIKKITDISAGQINLAAGEYFYF